MPRRARITTTWLLVVLSFSFAPRAQAVDDYQLGPDSQRQSGVPEGKVSQHHWKSNVFPGTDARLLGLCAGPVQARQRRPA